MNHTQKMSEVTKKMALEYHEQGKPGKIEVTPTKPYSTQKDLSLAYSPGVAYPCLEIKDVPSYVYKYTNKGNLVGVISNGTAVLGLGDIGALAGKPVMEGKALLFKIYAGLDAFDIEIDASDPDKVVEVVKSLAPTFGGINLEDIKAPECFRIEQRLKAELDIPVMHDDQHGTAIISGAGLLNALEIQKKDISEIKLVVNGAGAAAVSCTRLYIKLGVRPENIVMCDSKGVIRKDREKLTKEKAEFATGRDIRTLDEAMKDCDVFLGLSVADVLTPEMVRTMAPRPIVFALANPDPEISYEAAMSSRDDIIVATGRSDYPNQINNVIGFPYIFRGALDCRATCINEEMKIGAVYAIAALAKEPVPSVVDEAYGGQNIHFGREYILPKALDPRLLMWVAPAVAKAAMSSGVAGKPILDWKGYDAFLNSLMGDDGKMMRNITEIVRKKPQRIVFSETDNDNMLRAAATLRNDGVAIPILLGNDERIQKRAERLGIDVNGMEIVNPRNDNTFETRQRYARILFDTRCRNGVTLDEAASKLTRRSYFGMMMVKTGDADCMMGGVYSAAGPFVRKCREIIGLRPGVSHFATMHILHTRQQGTIYMADTGVNTTQSVDSLVDIALLADSAVRTFDRNPVMAMLSYSNFGSSKDAEEPKMAAEAVEILHRNHPEIEIDGEMQLNYALNPELRMRDYPFTTLGDKKVNTLIFPNLMSANATYKMLLAQGIGSIIGPIQIGLNKPVYFTSVASCERDIVNLATIACLEAFLKSRKESQQ